MLDEIKEIQFETLGVGFSIGISTSLIMLYFGL